MTSCPDGHGPNTACGYCGTPGGTPREAIGEFKQQWLIGLYRNGKLLSIPTINVVHFPRPDHTVDVLLLDPVYTHMGWRLQMHGMSAVAHGWATVKAGLLDGNNSVLSGWRPYALYVEPWVHPNTLLLPDGYAELGYNGAGETDQHWVLAVQVLTSAQAVRITADIHTGKLDPQAWPLPVMDY